MQAEDHFTAQILPNMLMESDKKLLRMMLSIVYSIKPLNACSTDVPL